MSKGKVSLDFATLCSEECDLYVALLDVDEKVLGKAAKDVDALLSYLQTQSVLPLLLSGLKCLDPADFARLVRSAVSIVVRYSVIANSNQSDLESKFYATARDIRSRKDQGETSGKILFNAKASLAKLDPADSIVTAGVSDLMLTRGQAQYMLTTLANAMQSKTKEIAIDDATLEHVFPQNPGPQWTNADELKDLVWHIGNLTVLGSKLNFKAGNDGYAEKRKQYNKSEIEMTKSVASSYTAWNRASVEKRAQQLTPLVLKSWKM